MADGQRAEPLERLSGHPRELSVLDDDPLVKTAVLSLLARDGSTRDLGLGRTGGQPCTYVGVHGLLGVAACPLRGAARSPGGALRAAGGVLYVLADPLAAELHRLHGCASVVCVFFPDTAGGRLEPLPSPGRLEAAGLTPREAEVLALLLARRTNAEIREQLVLSEATVRAHCRSVLRKLGAADRRALWAALPPAARW
jgi:DNA-binding CsgD family transcriptional regulator